MLGRQGFVVATLMVAVLDGILIMILVHLLGGTSAEQLVAGGAFLLLPSGFWSTRLLRRRQIRETKRRSSVRIDMGRPPPAHVGRMARLRGKWPGDFGGRARGGPLESYAGVPWRLTSALPEVCGDRANASLSSRLFSKRTPPTKLSGSNGRPLSPSTSLRDASMPPAKYWVSPTDRQATQRGFSAGRPSW